MGTLRSIRVYRKKKGFLGYRFPEAEPAVYTDESLETTEAEVYVNVATEHSTPVNLPMSETPLSFEVSDDREESQSLTALENQAHAQRVLLSSDAMRYLIAKVTKSTKQSDVLEQVIAKARVSFPSEDGWVVLNLARMEQLIDEVNITDDSAIVDGTLTLGVPVSTLVAGSLAEAIVAGNENAIETLIAQRPMIALADAASDIDALYKRRNGEVTTVSDMLLKEAIALTNKELEDIIVALTSALDGTHTDEVSAVRMAISKALAIVKK